MTYNRIEFDIRSLMKKVIIVAGPTASGKTKYTINLARSSGGEIINCDSLQVYKDLKTLTARPNEEEMSSGPHKLFGYLDAHEKITAVEWAKMAAIAVEEALQDGRLPIIVGGTGLYINTLINGISPMPEVQPETRAKVATMAFEDYEGLCEKLYRVDSKIAELVTMDKHRQIQRAYEVFLETGKSILEFYNKPRISFIDNVRYEYQVMSIGKTELHARITERFMRMLATGAIEEVQAFLTKIGSGNMEDFPVLKAIGAKEIIRYLHGVCSLHEATASALINSRRYAKRQMTWLRTQIPECVDVFHVAAT